MNSGGASLRFPLAKPVSAPSLPALTSLGQVFSALTGKDGREMKGQELESWLKLETPLGLTPNIPRLWGTTLLIVYSALLCPKP